MIYDLLKRYDDCRYIIFDVYKIENDNVKIKFITNSSFLDIEALEKIEKSNDNIEYSPKLS